MRHPSLTTLAVALSVAAASPAIAHGPDAHTGGIASAAARAVQAPFDIVHTKITTEGNTAIFHMAVSGAAGAARPAKSGKLAGSTVFSYVWPTSLDPATIGFEPKAGILAFAVTAHPDFDDTPLFDENGDGELGNDGDVWHSHWVVLQPDPACGQDALKVVDIAEGAKPRLPKTWPGLPILIDSPGWAPRIAGHSVEVRVPFDDVAAIGSAGFDGVTAALRVNASVHNPLLCVVDVFKVASGDLSLPGRVDR
ncbi:hypothetical protein [Cognatiluteimonas weifangensis]|uniref:Uncharacterized protein n=1 Tax=Cognatiluteimonas weifangensis TaxID=2303539 RepID=A0A372DN78_9GAMM|nr:hypothetical protein [Luteimonas weifangensis]RFP60762.1 hypothetical protein D0Y53_06305 [Luteimonas weifangensis]